VNNLKIQVVTISFLCLIGCRESGIIQKSDSDKPTGAVKQDKSDSNVRHPYIKYKTIATKGTGALSGELSYGGEWIPPFKIVATNITTGENYFTKTKIDAKRYRISGLSPGSYTILAYPIKWKVEAGLVSGFTYYVPCAGNQGCNDHRMLPVVIEAGAEAININPSDDCSDKPLPIDYKILEEVRAEGDAIQAKNTAVREQKSKR